MEEPSLTASAPAPEERRPGLYIVASPIGHLADITLRALETLRRADLIACEDTRHSLRLLQHYHITKPLISLNEHNEARRIPELISGIQAGSIVALLSDAGMPTVSDPGQRLVHAVLQADCHVEVNPGPSAVLTALAASGLPTTPFYFGGFLPHKKGQRAKELAAARERDCTSIYFESPYRLVDTLDIICQQAPQHLHVVARELTKKFEEYRRGSAQELADHYRRKGVKGELCLLVAPGELPKWAREADTEAP
jgi:16S rRNA (cytidine1402-2'-O)-methyltransferase